MGVVVRRYIDILTIIIYYSTCISSFFGSSIPTSLFILKNVFSVFIIYHTYGFSVLREVPNVKRRQHSNVTGRRSSKVKVGM